jgi:eukaryotic-like serine/threonine-protein kinase
MLSQLRAAGGGDRARVVVMSRRIPADERWRFSVLGVRDFLTKPTSFMMLVEALQKVAERMGPADPPESTPRSRRGASLADPDGEPRSRRGT